MGFVFRIDDISTPKAKAFLEYIKTLDFIQSDEEEVSLSTMQIDAINEARVSLAENGGIPHEVAIAKMKKKFLNAFRS